MTGIITAEPPFGAWYSTMISVSLTYYPMPTFRNETNRCGVLDGRSDLMSPDRERRDVPPEEQRMEDAPRTKTARDLKVFGPSGC